MLFAALLALLGLQNCKVGKQEKIIERQRKQLMSQARKNQVDVLPDDLPAR